MEERYKKLRNQLEQLGYNFSLKPDSAPLVEKLVADLVQTTESLQKYMKIAKDVIDERDNLLLGAEPYKCDNAKLVRECNDLHLALLQFREQSEKLQRDLRKHISALEKEKILCDSEKEKLQNRIRALELESAKKTDRILSLQSAKLGIKPTIKSSSTSTLLKNKLNTTQNSESEVMAVAEQRIKSLMNEISRLKEENLELIEANNSYKTQINNRNKEIQRLTSLLEGGRPIEALKQDCCYKDIDLKVSGMQDEINFLKKKNSDLENRLKDAVSKQHEAMKRALNLAERNKILEKEMRDIDRMALAVESECNSTTKCNAEKLNRLQDRLQEALLQVQELERNTADLKREKRELLSDFESVKTEKRHLQKVLETALDEKKRLTDRVNQFTIIENDLNLEIDRLVRLSSSQKQRIAELECRLFSDQLDTTGEQKPTHKIKSKKVKKSGKSSSPRKTRKQEAIIVSPFRPYSRIKSPYKRFTGQSAAGIDDPIFVPNNSPAILGSFRDGASEPRKGGRKKSESETDNEETERKKNKCPDLDGCIKEIKKLFETEFHNKDVCLTHLRELIGREMDSLQAQTNMSLEHLKTERDYYMKECHALMDKLKCMCNKSDNNSELSRKLNEKEALITTLQHENRCLSQEKHNLMTRLENARDRFDNGLDSVSLRSTSKRLERERDLMKADVQRLEEERDALRQRIKEMGENHAKEKSKLQSVVSDAEAEVRKLETERRDLMSTQGSRRATINNLQDECDLLRDQLKKCQSELNQQRAVYNQLKILHEQTDLALSDSQSQLIQLEKEMHLAQERIRSFERQGGDTDKEILNLRNDITIMKGNLAKIDQEKDSLLSDLDEKTEKIAALEHELKSKENSIVALETAVGDLKKKISITEDNSISREQLLRNATLEVQKLQQDLETAIRAKELACQENRRIQEDLAACTADCRQAHNELDIARRQIDDLKRQLQQYVAEVKRTEDLISHKEIERSEMLNQFRSLSQEATVLESNNHSLENEATQAKVQLSVALDHANDLERKLEAQETMTRSYEKQIADMTAQIARMEVQISQQARMQQESEAAMADMRELCMKLDRQKDGLMKQLNDLDTARSQVGREADRLRRETETLQNTLSKDRNSHENLEGLLAQCRQECIDQKLLNQELQTELQRCKNKVEELQIKLSNLSNSPQNAKVPDDFLRNENASDKNYKRLPKWTEPPNKPPDATVLSEAARDSDQSKTSVRRLSFSLPDDTCETESAQISRILRKELGRNAPMMDPIMESDLESQDESDQSRSFQGSYKITSPNYTQSKPRHMSDRRSLTSLPFNKSLSQQTDSFTNKNIDNEVTLGTLNYTHRSSDAQSTKNLPYTSISGYISNFSSIEERDSIANLSMLPYASPLNRINISQKSSRASADEEQDNPKDDNYFRSLRNKPCACVRVCKCHENDLSVAREGYHKMYSAFASGVAPVSTDQKDITCVFTSSGPLPKCYTATYTFAFENNGSAPILPTKISAEKYASNKQS